VRLKALDYAENGLYFITICTYQRENTLGRIDQAGVRLSAIGKVVEEEWLRIPMMRPNIELDDYVIMPNHLHGILIVQDPAGQEFAEKPATNGRTQCAPTEFRRRPRSLGSIVAGFKAATTSRVSRRFWIEGAPLWQRNYYEHVIRNDADADSLRRYMQANPERWAEDVDNPHQGQVIRDSSHSCDGICRSESIADGNPI